MANEKAHDVPGLRRRVHLEVVSPAEPARGLRVPSGTRVMYRGSGADDYACGACGVLIAIGVQRGVLRSLLFDCVCGATNRVPSGA